TLRKAAGVSGLYVFHFKQSTDGTVSVVGTSERGNKISSKARPGQSGPVSETVTLAGGSRKTDHLGPLEVTPPDSLANFDTYRVVIIGSGGGRGNPTATATQLTSVTQEGLTILKSMTQMFAIRPTIS